MKFTTTGTVSLGGRAYSPGEKFEPNEEQKAHLERHGAVLVPALEAAAPVGEDTKPTEQSEDSVAEKVGAMHAKAEVVAFAAGLGIELKSTKLVDMKAELLAALEAAAPVGEDTKPTEQS